MYSRYISSLTRFSPLSLIPLDFLVIFLSSPFLVFISRVSLLFTLYSIHAAVLFSCSFIYLRMVPVFPLTVLLFLFYSPFFLPVLFFFLSFSFAPRTFCAPFSSPSFVRRTHSFSSRKLLFHLPVSFVCRPFPPRLFRER